MAKTRSAGSHRKPAGKAGPRAVVFHSLEQATAALTAAAELGVPVTLWSAPGAAGYAGAGWFKAVIDELRATVPKTAFTAVLDCADMPGYALGAFRIGVENVCFTGPSRVAAKLADIAAQQGRTLLRRRPVRALDLRLASDPLALCRTWLKSVNPA